MGATTIWNSLHLLKYLVLIDFLPSPDFKLQEGNEVSVWFMILLHG